MRQLLEQLRERIAQFIAQRDSLVLLIGCSDADAGAAVKILEGLDEASTSELFWIVVDAFDDPTSFAQACVQGFVAKHQAISLTLEKQGRPWPPLPNEIAQPGLLPPGERLKRLVVFSRSLLPTLEGCVVVWGFLPMKVDNPPVYADFMSGLWQHEFPFPWCHHTRLIIRDNHPNPWFAARDSAPRGMQRTLVDLSPASLRQALETEASDDRAPLADRINCALVLAGMDFSHGQYDRALQQYDLVHRYAASTNDPTLAALALSGMGEVNRAQGSLERAGEFFQAALAPAVLAPQPPVPILLNLYLNLGELRFAQERWQEAEVYLHGAGEFAGLMRDPEQRLRCWDLLGEAQSRQSNAEAAAKTWSNGAVVAGRLKLEKHCNIFLQRLQTHYNRQRDESGLRAAISRIQAQVSTGNKAPALSEPPPSGARPKAQ